MVIGVVEGSPIGLQSLCAQHGVVEHTLHAVSITAFSRHSQQIARQLEMCITPTGRLETAMCARKAAKECVSIRGNKSFFGSPAAGRKTLRRGDHVKRIAGSPEVLYTACGQISLHRGAQRIAEAVGMMVSEHVLVVRKRVEIGLIEKKPRSQSPVTLAGSALPRQI